MDKLAEQINRLGYSLLELDKIIYFGIDTGQTPNCHNGGTCEAGCALYCITAVKG